MEKEKKAAEKALTKFSTSLDTLQTAVQPVLSSLDTLRTSGAEESLDALSKARLHITLCYTVNSLFCMYLRTQGVDPNTHPVSEEISRVQDAFLRLCKVEANVPLEPKRRPKRDTSLHIAKAKIAADKLSAVVFPEEVQLLHALRNTATKRKRFEASDDDESQSHDDSMKQLSTNTPGENGHVPQHDDTTANGHGEDDDQDDDQVDEEDTPTRDVTKKEIKKGKKKDKKKDKRKKASKKERKSSDINSDHTEKKKKRKQSDDASDVGSEKKKKKQRSKDKVKS